MVDIVKPNMNKVWAAAGAVVKPEDSKIETGWTSEVPPHQFENWAQNRQDMALSYLMQKGISVWDAATEYTANKSYVQGSDGNIYYALKTVTNDNPVTSSSASWRMVVNKNSDASKPSYEIATVAEVTAGVNNTKVVTPLGLQGYSPQNMRRNQIPSGTDLNTCVTFDLYSSQNTAITNSLLNCPVRDSAFMLRCEIISDTQLIQTLTPFNRSVGQGKTWQRKCVVGTWSNWLEFFTSENLPTGLSGTLIDTTGYDLNNADSATIYNCTGQTISASVLNKPDGVSNVAFVVVVTPFVTSTNSSLRQDFYNFSVATPKHFTRVRSGTSATGTWGNWIETYTSVNMQLKYKNVIPIINANNNTLQLSETHIGAVMRFGHNSSGTSQSILPPATSDRIGSTLTFISTTTAGRINTLTASGDDIITGLYSGDSKVVTFIANDTLTLVCSAAGVWLAISGSLQQPPQRTGFALKPIGEVFYVYTHMQGSEVPNNNGTAKYIKLTANDTFNNGLLNNQQISGTAPNITAVAAIMVGTMTGSSVYLENTMGTYRRAFTTSGTVQGDAIRNITGAYGINGDYDNRGALHGTVIANFNRSQSANGQGQSSLTFDASRAPNVVVANENRPFTLTATAYMRVL